MISKDVRPQRKQRYEFLLQGEVRQGPPARRSTTPRNALPHLGLDMRLRNDRIRPYQSNNSFGKSLDGSMLQFAARFSSAVTFN